MKARLIAGVIAVVLAIAGTVILVGYVRGADDRAMAGVETVDVLVAGAPIPLGTLAADLPTLVASKQLPAVAALPNRVISLEQLTGMVALVAFEPGEQLLASKFGVEAALTPGDVVIPPELQQVTISLDLKRVVGGRIKAGDTVGVFISLPDTKQTHLTVQKALVTVVQAPAGAVANLDSTTPASGAAVPAAPTDLSASVLITLATNAASAEKIVYAAEFGSIWLSNEPSSSDESGTQIIDGVLVFK